MHPKSHSMETVFTLPDLKDGDVCEIIQEDIGVLHNSIVCAKAA